MLKGMFSILASATTVLCLVSGCVFAGGPDSIPQAHALPMYNPNVYVQVDIGYANVDWADFTGKNFTDNSKGGFTVGGALGYSFMPNMAVEVGGLYLPEATSSKGKVSSWLVDAMAKLSVPVADELSIYGKAGAAYRSVDNHFNENRIGHYWSPVFGVGGEYQFTSNFYAQVEYIRVPSNTDLSNKQNEAAAVNTYTLNLGYQFDA